MTFPLRERHPSLFYLLLVKAAVNTVLAAFLIFGNPALTINYRTIPDHTVIPLWFWAVLFLIIAATFLKGAFGKNFKWARRGLIWQTYLGGFWAFGFWISLMAGTIYGVSAPILWTLYTLNCVVLSGEPSINPITYANGKSNGSITD